MKIISSIRFVGILAATFFALRAVVAEPQSNDQSRLPQTKAEEAFSIEQMRSELRPRMQDRLPYFEKVTVDAYREVGRRNPKWDADVEMALRIYAQSMADGYSVFGRPAMREMIRCIKAASSAGCDDPLFKHLLYRTDDMCIPVGLAPKDRSTFYGPVLASLEAHPYPASRRCLIRLAAARSMKYSQIPMEVAYPEADALLFKAISELPEIAKEDINASELYSLIARLFRELDKPNKQETFEKVLPDLEASFSQKLPLLLTLKGLFYVNLAYSYGPREGDPMSIARAAFEAAWSLDQTDFNICKGMMDVTQETPEFEIWFHRCKQLDSHQAYGCKYHFTHPENGGSYEAMLKLGHQCLDEGDWEYGTPFMLIQAHDDIAAYWRSKKAGDYYVQPGVWEDIKLVYEEFLKRYPKNNMERSGYVKHAADCKHWKEAKAMLDQMGDLVVPSAFGLHDEFGGYRMQIERNAKAQANQSGGTTLIR